MKRYNFYKQSGQALVETGLLVALIALVAVPSIGSLGEKAKCKLGDAAVNEQIYHNMDDYGVWGMEGTEYCQVIPRGHPPLDLF